MRRINARGVALVKHFEGDRLESYRCPAGKWTISVGVTGDHVRAGMKISQAESDAMFAEALRHFESGVFEAIRVPVTDGMFAACVSLAYNIGLPAFKNSTLLRLLNNKLYQEAAAQFGRWIHSGGQVLPGLVRRRAAERELFLSRL